MNKELWQQLDKAGDKAWERLAGIESGIGEAVSLLAKKLGVAATKILEIYTKQEFLVGLIYLAAGIMIIILACYLIRIIYRCANNTPQSIGNAHIGKIITLIVGIGASMPFMSLGVLRLANPQYYALQTIMEHIQGIIK